MSYQQRVETYHPDGTVEVSSRTVETTPEQDNDRTLRDRAQAALDNNRTFLAVTSPTSAQNAAQIRALTRQMNAVVRLVLGQLDSTD